MSPWTDSSSRETLYREGGEEGEEEKRERREGGG